MHIVGFNQKFRGLGAATILMLGICMFVQRAHAQDVLLIHSNTIEGATQFVDSSGAGHPISLNGNLKHSTAAKKFGMSSIYYDGAGGSLRIPDSADWDFGSGDWTVDFWLQPTTFSLSSARIIIGTYSYGLYKGWNVSLVNGKLQLAADTDGVASWDVVIADTASLVAGQWYHVAAVRNGNNWSLYKNGVKVAGMVKSGAIVPSSDTLDIGESSVDYRFGGYLDEIRINKGVACWIADFTPPTAPYTGTVNSGPSDSCVNASFFLKSNTTSNNMYFVDGSCQGYPIAVSGNVQNTTAVKKFGASSIYFDGTGGSLRIPDRTDWDFGSADWTVDFWLQPTTFSLSGIQIIIGTYSYGLYKGWTISLVNGKLQLAADTDGAANWEIQIADTTGLTAGQWYHVAAVRYGNDWSLYKNGVKVAAIVKSGAIAPSNDTLDIGESSYDYRFGGYLDEIRINKGVALWTANFTLPAAAKPCVDASFVLKSDTTDNSTLFVDSSCQENLITVSGNIRHTTATKKFGASSIYFDGAGGSLRIPNNSNWDFGSANWTVDFWLQPTAYSLSGINIIMGTYSYGLYKGWSISLVGGKLQLAADTNGAGPWDIQIADTASLAVGQWYHVAAVRNGTDWSLYKNGVKVVGIVKSGGIVPSNDTLDIGESSYDYRFGGYLDEIRISKGVAQWTQNFTPPASPYPLAYPPATVPTALQFTNVASNSMRVGWGTGNNAVGTLYFCENMTNQTNSGWTKDAYWTNTGLTTETMYTYRVKARNLDGVETGWSALASQATSAPAPPPVAPGVPQWTSISRNRIAMTWATSNNAADTRYFCENMTNQTNSGWITSQAWTNYDLTPETIYTYRVKARNIDGVESDWSPTATQSTIAPVPTDLPTGTIYTRSAAFVGETVTVCWNATGRTNVGVYYSKTERKPSNSFSTGVVGGSGNLIFPSAGVYYVQLYSGDPWAGYPGTLTNLLSYVTVTVSDPPAAPCPVPNTPGAPQFSNVAGTNMLVSWSTNDNPAGTQYYCENTTNYTNSGWITFTNWVNSNLKSETAYTYRVKAKNANGVESAWSSVAVKSTIIPAPGELAPGAICVRSTMVVGETATVTWNATGYADVHVRYSLNELKPMNVFSDGEIASSKTITLTSPGVYYFQLYSGEPYTGYPESLDHLISSAILTVTPPHDAIPPTSPFGLTATAASSTEVNLSWQSAYDEVGVMGYKVYCNGVYRANTALLNYSDMGLQPGTTYTYTITAYDAYGNESAPSNAVTIATSADTNKCLVINSDTFNGSVQFSDDSSRHHAVTAYGNAQHSTTSKVTGQSSMRFDGDGDYLAVNDSSAFDFGNTDWTMDYWAYINSKTGYQIVLNTGGQTGESGGILLGFKDDKFYFQAGANSLNFTGAAALNGAWHHYVVERRWTTLRYYVDGQLMGTSSIAGCNFDSAHGPYIGGYLNSSMQGYLNGYIDGITVRKTPTDPPEAGNANNSLIIDSNTTQERTFNFVDQSIWQHPVTRNGNVIHTTGIKLYSKNSSVQFDGDGDYLAVADSSAFDFGAGDWSIDYWAYINAKSGNQIVLNTGGQTGESGGILLGFKDNKYYFQAGANTIAFTGAAQLTGGWHHFAVTRDGNFIRHFVDGQQIGISSFAACNFDSAHGPYIGAYLNGSMQGYLNGNIDGIRINKGIALWSADFIIFNNGQPYAVPGEAQTLVDWFADGVEDVILDGSQSFDTERGPLTYLWTEGGEVLATTAIATIPVTVKNHWITLTVTDDKGATATGWVNVSFRPNQAPVANAGKDQTIGSESGNQMSVIMDGAKSYDPEWGPITSWVWTEGSRLLVQKDDYRSPTVFLGDGLHEITLTVTDNYGATGTDTVLINVVRNLPPVADAGDDRIAYVENSQNQFAVQVDGSRSYDPETGKLNLQYEWWKDTLLLSTDEKPYLLLRAGVHVIRLKVTDNFGFVDTDYVVITVRANRPPVANAGNDQTVIDFDSNGFHSVTLDGRGSSDPEMGNLTYYWREGTNPPFGTSALMTVNLGVGTHRITLTVTDDRGASSADEVVIIVSTPKAANASTLDSDNDGVPNEVESALGKDPYSSGSKPSKTIYYEYDELGRIKRVFRIK